jgi:TatD DNase family protein
MKLFDVHTHIQDERLENRQDRVIARAIDAGVGKIMVCGLHEGDWAEVAAMADQYPEVVPALGIHPWFIENRSPRWADTLARMIEENNAAVGEIGLDRMIPRRNDDDQESVFMTQMGIARDLGKPVNLHCRSAWGRMLELLKSMGGLPHGGVVHSWSGSAEMIREFEALGAYISFSGSATRPDNKKVRKSVQATSWDRLVIETDSPDILPTGIDAILNEPAYVRAVLEAVASIRYEDAEDTAIYTYENSIRLFSSCKNCLNGYDGGL